MEAVSPNFLEQAENGSVRCELCPRRCVFHDGTGVCKVRAASALPFYGRVSSIAVDPIEKKPLFHYRPGSFVLSLGFVGCNLRCPFCQNWRISQSVAEAGPFMAPEEAVARAIALGLTQIAYTYSEPLVHAEYFIACARAAHKAGLANVLVTNGCVTEAAAAAIIPHADAANIDLKCFSAANYERTLGGSLDAVTGFIRMTFEAGVHIEITTLVVPGFNDGEAEIEECVSFIASVSPDIPWHVSAYHPAYKWDAAPASREAVLGIRERARRELRYCYAGNVEDAENDTRCADCGAVLVRRDGYRVETDALGCGSEGYYCEQCGAAAPIR
jgi:pyruvate formate lyase activating enzyme